jgi:hypothetical protein
MKASRIIYIRTDDRLRAQTEKRKRYIKGVKIIHEIYVQPEV